MNMAINDCVTKYKNQQLLSNWAKTKQYIKYNP